MSWLDKLLPPKIKRTQETERSVPEGLWSKCPACEAVLYHTDLDANLQVCPKCGHHHGINARTRLSLLLDETGQTDIAANVTPVDILKFTDTKKYADRLKTMAKDTGETDALVVKKGTLHGHRPRH